MHDSHEYRGPAGTRNSRRNICPLIERWTLDVGRFLSSHEFQQTRALLIVAHDSKRRSRSKSVSGLGPCINAIASPSVKFPHQPVEIVHKPKPTSLAVRSVSLKRIKENINHRVTEVTKKISLSPSGRRLDQSHLVRSNRCSVNRSSRCAA